jgi:hypothetical protein
LGVGTLGEAGKIIGQRRIEKLFRGVLSDLFRVFVVDLLSSVAGVAVLGASRNRDDTKKQKAADSKPLIRLRFICDS